MQRKFKQSIKKHKKDYTAYVNSIRSAISECDEALTPNDLEILVDAFKENDKDMNSYVPMDTLASLTSDANLDSVPTYEIRNFLSEKNVENKITPKDLYLIYTEVTRRNSEADPNFKQQLSRNCSKKIIKQYKTSEKKKVQSFFSTDEILAYTNWINFQLKGKKMAKHKIPLDKDDPNSFFEALDDGVILCLMLQLVSDNLIDDRAINIGKDGSEISIFKKIENINLAIGTARSIGCNMINQNSSFIMEKNITMCLGLVWQTIRAGLLAKISLNDNPHLMRLALDGETKEDLLKLSQEDLLLRWVNYQLNQNEHYDGMPINNFSSNIKDSVAYQYLLEEIQPKNTGLVANPEKESNLMVRAEETLKMADVLNSRQFVGPKEICKGHPKLNLAFVANLFNMYPNLEPMEDVEQIIETREEKTYRNWINSLGIKPQVNYLYTDLQNGVPLLKLEDHISPGIINWKRVNLPPYKTFGGFMRRIENCDYAVTVAPELDVKVVCTRGNDIANGVKTLTLGLVWQLMRAYTISLLTELSDDKSKKLKDSDVVAWYNEKTNSHIRSFKDSSLSNSIGFATILKSIKPDLEMHELESASSTEEKMSNAKYIISMARKMGAIVYTLPEDIVESEGKMVLCFVVTLMVLEKSIGVENEDDEE